MINKDKYYCYVLKSTNPDYPNLTYNGSTNNLVRRLRQHNGEIVCGAKATRGRGPWQIYIVLEGFQSSREALSCEWRIKHPTNTKIRPSKYNGVEGRVKSFNELICLDNWTSKSTGLCSGNEYKLYLHPEHFELIDFNIKKPNLEIKIINDLDFIQIF